MFLRLFYVVQMKYFYFGNFENVILNCLCWITKNYPMNYYFISSICLAFLLNRAGCKIKEMIYLDNRSH